MNGRIYDPLLGRMLSPDPIVQAPTNLQSYNRYSYVFNNPLRFTDPTGFTAAEDEEKKKQQEKVDEAWKKLAAHGIVGVVIKNGEVTGVVVSQAADQAQPGGAAPHVEKTTEGSVSASKKDGEVDSDRPATTGGRAEPASATANASTSTPSDDAKAKFKGIAFVRLNLLESDAKVDSNAKTWKQLVEGLRDKLVESGDIEKYQLQFVMARTRQEAIDQIKAADMFGFEIVLSSHGHPSDNDYKSMFGRNIYKRPDFFADVNQAAKKTILTVETTWYSCDNTNGTRTPTQVFNEEAQEHLTSRLLQINSTK